MKLTKFNHLVISFLSSFVVMAYILLPVTIKASENGELRSASSSYLKIQTDATTYKANEKTTFQTSFNGEGNVDIYSIIVCPDGRFRALVYGSWGIGLTEAGTLGVDLIPVFISGVNLFEMPMISLFAADALTFGCGGDSGGTYGWYMLMVEPGSDPFDDNHWLAFDYCSFEIEASGSVSVSTPEEIASKYGNGLFAQIITEKGEIVCTLEFEKTPLTVINFVGLAEGSIAHIRGAGVHYYDGLIFHRVIANFMIQGGCPYGTGSGGPGYKFKDEIVSELTHSGPGILSMANAGANTNGSQFFITHLATPWLDGKHTVFGHVVQGQEIVDVIENNDRIIKVIIARVGEKALAFESDQVAFDRHLIGR